MQAKARGISYQIWSVMRLIQNFVLTVFIATVVMTVDARPLTDTEKTCAFKNTVVIGASISAQTAMTIPFYHKMVSALALRQGKFMLPAFGPSPVNLFLNLYSGQSWGGNKTDLSKMFTNQQEYLGSSQVQSLLTGPHREAFLKAGTVFGLDAFYWDAIWGNCGYGNGDGVEAVIENLIREARTNHINLVLGNVPHEDPSHVLIDSDALGIPGLWYKPEDKCVDSINSTLKAKCSKADGCYIIDFESAVAQLNAGKKLTLNNGASYSLFRIRPDGVHVSTYGAKLLEEKIVAEIESAPPTCRP